MFYTIHLDKFVLSYERNFRQSVHDKCKCLLFVSQKTESIIWIIPLRPYDVLIYPSIFYVVGNQYSGSQKSYCYDMATLIDTPLTV